MTQRAQPARYLLIAKAYEGAMERLEKVPASSVSPDIERAFAAIGEALLWAVLLENTLESQEYLGDVYRQEKETDSNGYLLHGLRFARNKLQKESSLAGLLEVRTSHSSTYGVVFGEWCWRQLAKRTSADGADVYRKDLEGQPARATLRRVRPFFERMVREVEISVGDTP